MSAPKIASQDPAAATQVLTYKFKLEPSRGQHDKLRAALDQTRDLRAVRSWR